MDLPQDYLDYQERFARLRRFDAGIDAILREGLGADGTLPTSEDEGRLLTPRQRDWQELRCFFEASIVNSGDLFSYLSIIYSLPEMFEQIEAVKTLAAAEELRPFYDAYSELQNPDEKDKYLQETREQREPIEWKAEDSCEFADLLIRFAERHPEEFREMEAPNPLDHFSEVMGAVHRKASESGIDTKALDLAAGTFDQMRHSLSNGDTIDELWLQMQKSLCEMNNESEETSGEPASSEDDKAVS